MTVQEYICKRGHVTECIVITWKHVPRYAVCKHHRGGAASTHYEGCQKVHECGLRASVVGRMSNK